MDKHLKNAINKLYHTMISKESFLGLMMMMVLSKEYFPTNKEVSTFIEKVFGLVFLDYAVRSRTLMAAKLARKINAMTDDELKMYTIVLMSNLRPELNYVEENDSKKSTSSKKKAINNLNNWFGEKSEGDEK